MQITKICKVTTSDVLDIQVHMYNQATPKKRFHPYEYSLVIHNVI